MTNDGEWLFQYLSLRVVVEVDVKNIANPAIC